MFDFIKKRLKISDSRGIDASISYIITITIIGLIFITRDLLGPAPEWKITRDPILKTFFMYFMVWFFALAEFFIILPFFLIKEAGISLSRIFIQFFILTSVLVVVAQCLPEGWPHGGSLLIAIALVGLASIIFYTRKLVAAICLRKLYRTLGFLLAVFSLSVFYILAHGG